MAERGGVIDCVLAMRRDDDGAAAGEEAGRGEGVVAYLRDGVAGEHHAGVPGVRAIGVTDEGRALATLGERAHERDGEWRLAGASEHCAADAEEAHAFRQAQRTSDAARAEEAPRRAQRTGGERGITALESTGDERAERVGEGGAPIQTGIMAKSESEHHDPRPADRAATHESAGRAPCATARHGVGGPSIPGREA